MPFFDRAGNPIDVLEWGRLYEQDRTIAYDEVGRHAIKTVWHGFVEDYDPSLRLFGTALFLDGRFVQELQGYDDEAAALLGHQRHLNQLKADLSGT